MSHAGLINLESQWGTSDTAYSRKVNTVGPVWRHGPVWREQNPARLAVAFRTPVLVTVGEQDFRVPSRLVVFPDENHGILKSENSLLVYQEVNGWLEGWLAPPAAN